MDRAPAGPGELPTLPLGTLAGQALKLKLDGPQPQPLFVGGTADQAGSVPLQVAGKLQAMGLSFDSELIRIFEDRITFSSKVSLPDRFGLSFGETELELELKLAEGTLCGSGRNAATGCDVRACFRGPNPNDVDLSITCGGRQGCTADGQCPAGQVCYGFFCTRPLDDDSFCTRDAECQSGRCAVTCYTAPSRGQGQACNPVAIGQCQQNLVCAGAICLPRVGYGLICSDSAQCDAGQTCRAVLGGGSAGRLGGALIEVRRCLYPAGSRALNETCSQSSECGSGMCELGTGRCTCTEAYCNTPPREGVYVPPQYCDVDRQCKRKLADGRACCGSKQCLGGRCTVPVCARRRDGTPVAQGSCYTPGAAAVGASCYAPEHCASSICLLGVCRCASSAHCPGQRCSWSLLDGSAGDCVALRRVGEGCNPLRPEECATSHCAGFLAPAVCYQPGVRGYSQSCMANDHCGSGRCGLDCSFNLTDCNPLNLASLDPADCGCRPRCECSADEDCGNRKYCGSLEVLGQSFGDLKRCRDKKGDGDPCTRDGQCRDNKCACTQRCIAFVCWKSCTCE
ncbi:MAG: hypothetical protein FJ125_11005 [Deltaproteobacteria bacterium]|nr:hypothetical protein [Deltaproteobacteria bacterium]